MNFSEFQELVLNKLEEKGFDKLIIHYQPPEELAAWFVSTISKTHYDFYNVMHLNCTHEKDYVTLANEAATTIVEKFTEVASELFPSSNKVM